MRVLLIMVGVLLLAASTPAQTTPFLSDDQIRMLNNELSGDRSFEHIRWLSHWHRDSGMEGYFKAAEYVMKAAKEAGLEDVRFIEQPLNGPNYTARVGELWMVEPIEVKLADIGDHAVHLADGSHSANVTAELVWVGECSPEELQKVDVAGKMVLTSAHPQVAVQRAVWERGALGVICFSPSEGKSAMDFPDQVAWRRIPITPPPGKKGTFAFVLSPRKGDTLRAILAEKGMQDLFAVGKRTPGGRIVVKAKVETEIGTAPGRTGFVEGWIRGSKYHDQQIIITAHLQEEQGSANDDGSGCGNILEIARTFNKLIREGKMARPLRDIRFWWTDEIYSEYRYFQDFPGEPKKFLVNLHQDMTGARQSLGSRVQHLILPPYSRTSYLDTLFESVGNYIIYTNNAFLAAGRAGGLPRPHSRPIYSARGSREGYNARFVPYFSSSDHMCFVEGVIGVPAVALINWDDEFIHSTDDDIDKIDQTQLKRNAFYIAAMAYFLSFAEAKDIPLIAGETFALGSSRLAHALKTAMASVKESEEGWKDASMIVETAVARELRALDSARVFATGNESALRTIDELTARMKTREREMMSDLASYYQQLRGRAAQPVALSAAELAASKKIPVNNASLKEYFENRFEKLDYFGNLHSLMRAEVFNFVDGTRSYYDIYKAVRAEALTTGAWYYGTVTLEDVTGLLDAAVTANVIKLK